MRLGQLLVESSFITQSELSTALAYAQTKGLQIGRCMVLLRMVTDDQIKLALTAQMHIRSGLEAKLAVELLRTAFRDKADFQQVLLASASRPIRDYLEHAGTPQAPAAPAATAVVGGPPAAPVVTPEPLVEHQDDVSRIRAMTKRIETLIRLQQISEVAAVVEEALVLGRRNLTADDGAPAKAMGDLADALAIAGQRPLAMDCYLLAGEMLEHRLPSSLVDAICNLRAASVVGKDLPEKGQRKRLGELFIAAGLVNEEQLQQGLAHAKQTGAPLGNALEQLKLITPKQLTSMVHCQMLIQQAVVPEEVAIQALRLAWRQDMDLKRFTQGANIPPAKQNSPEEKALSDCLDNLLGLEAKGEAKSLEAAALCVQLGDMYLARDSIFDAEHSYRRAHNIFKEQAKGSTELLRSALGLSGVLMRQNRTTEAHAVMLNTMNAIPSTPSMELVEYFERLGHLEYAQGASMSAYSVVRSAIAIMDQMGCQDEKLRASTADLLAKCAEEMGMG